jgi:hypothetical protein
MLLTQQLEQQDATSANREISGIFEIEDDHLATDLPARQTAVTKVHENRLRRVVKPGIPSKLGCIESAGQRPRHLFAQDAWVGILRRVLDPIPTVTFPATGPLGEGEHYLK